MQMHRPGSISRAGGNTTVAPTDGSNGGAPGGDAEDDEGDDDGVVWSPTVVPGMTVDLQTQH